MYRYLQPFILFFLLIFAANASAQTPCIADAGSDTLLVCDYRWDDTVRLDGTASGGVPPYTYLWEGVWEPGGGISWDATYYLDDVNSPKPWFHNGGINAGMYFYLTVTDSVGTTCTDSVWVNSCDNLVTLQYLIDFINQGDTSTLEPNGWSSCGVASIHWTPEYNISDPWETHPNVWPEYSTTYTATIVDSAGCQMYGGQMEIVVYPTGINSLSEDLIQLDVYPNPVRGGEALRLNGQITDDMTWQWYDGLGRMGASLPLQTGQTELPISDLASGLHFYQVLHGGQVVHRGKVTVD